MTPENAKEIYIAAEVADNPDEYALLFTELDQKYPGYSMRNLEISQLKDKFYRSLIKCKLVPSLIPF